MVDRLQKWLPLVTLVLGALGGVKALIDPLRNSYAGYALLLSVSWALLFYASLHLVLARRRRKHAGVARVPRFPKSLRRLGLVGTVAVTLAFGVALYYPWMASRGTTFYVADFYAPQGEDRLLTQGFIGDLKESLKVGAHVQVKSAEMVVKEGTRVPKWVGLDMHPTLLIWGYYDTVNKDSHDGRIYLEPQRPPKWMPRLSFRFSGDFYDAMADAQALAAGLARYVLDSTANPDTEFDNRGRTYFSEGEYDKAIEAYSAAINLDSGYAQALHDRGATYGKKREYGKAMEDCSKVISLRPGDVQALCDRGFTYNRMHEYDKAIQDFSNAMSLQPGLPRAYAGLGIAYFYTGNESLAEADLHKADQLAPGSAYYQLACIAALRGNADEAFRLLDSALAKQQNTTADAAGDKFFKSLHSDPRWMALLDKYRTE